MRLYALQVKILHRITIDFGELKTTSTKNEEQCFKIEVGDSRFSSRSHSGVARKISRGGKTFQEEGGGKNF